MRPKTAFELYLEEHPEQNHVSNTRPFQTFEPNTVRDGMVDFRPNMVPADGPDPEGYQKHVLPVGATAPKGWYATASAPTSPAPLSDDVDQIAGAEKVPFRQPPADPTPPGQKISSPKDKSTPSGSTEPPVPA